MADAVEDKVDAPVADPAPEQTEEDTEVMEEVNAPEGAEKLDEEEIKSLKVTLADLCAKGAAQYAHKNWTEACDCYAQASELQAEINGEMSPDNAEILFLYGRSLFKVGQSKSDVLGGRASGEQKKSKSASKKNGQSSKANGDDAAAEQVAAVAEENGALPKADDLAVAKKPLFQFTGDENFDDSDEEEEEEQDEEEEEEDDLAAAFEVLDLARVLFERKLEEPEETDSKGKGVGETSYSRHLKERLADTHDLLAEISLENERFPNAVNDFKSSIAYKKELFPQESEIIAEAHFKLSLALEFASITTQGDEEDGQAPKEAQVDEAMREEAAKELEAAIESTKLKLQNQEVELATSHSPEDNDTTRAQITDTKDIIADMEQRLVDLRAPPLDVNAALSGPAGAPDGVNPMGGILGKALGESPAEVQARVAEATKTATDLTGLVRKKKAKTAPEPVADANTNGKRKADELEQDAATEEAKKAKVEETAE